jgi:hypothetical protein
LIDPQWLLDVSPVSVPNVDKDSHLPLTPRKAMLEKLRTELYGNHDLHRQPLLVRTLENLSKMRNLLHVKEVDLWEHETRILQSEEINLILNTQEVRASHNALKYKMVTLIL